MSEIPFGLLGEIAKGKRGVSYKPEDIAQSTDQKHYRLLTAGNIQDGITTTESYTKVSDKCVSQEQLISPDDILVCMSNGSKRLVGKSSRLRFADSKQYCVGAFCSTFTPTGNADPEFIFQIFQSEIFRRQVSDALEGSAINNLKNSTIENFQVPLPPLSEQKKIAEILSGIDRSIQAKELSIHKTDFILRARKDDLMSGVEKWQEFELGELLAFRNGLNTEKENFGQGVPFVSYKNVYSGGIVTAKSLSQSVSLSTLEVERFSLRSGDILFTRTSETPDEIGFSCVFDDKHGSAVFNGFCIRGRPLEEGKLTPEFASFYLKSESVLAQMRFLCKYTTRAGISAESLSRVKVRIPDQSTQQQLANSLIAVNEFRTTQEESVRNLKNVKRAVSADLLSGHKRVSI
jgi:type I restriction enzyme S subunit